MSLFFFSFLKIAYSHHIFSYAHILAYLRQPVLEGQPESLPYSLQFHNFTPSHPPSPTLLQSRLEMLIEVRDEAAYLNLEALQKLCADEIRQRYGPRQNNHQRGNSTSSVPSIQNINASVYGLQTLSERAEPEFRNSPNASPIPLSNASQDPTASTTQVAIPASSPVFVPTGPVAPPQAAIAIRRGKQTNQTSAMAEGAVARTPPTPQSWDGPDQGRSQSRSSSRSRPTNATPPQSGWI